MIPDDLLSLARSLIAAPNAGEGHWREAARLAHRAVHHLVAAHLGLDPATFAGTERAVRETLSTIDPVHAPAFIREARRSITTSWIAAMRADNNLGEPFDERDARLCLAYAERVLAARAAAN
jgi:HEPN domain-containing protein